MEKKENLNMENISKESRIVLFLKDSENIKGREEINILWRKYKLNERSNSINIRVLERFFGVYNKYSNEKKIEKVKYLKESLIESKIDYGELIKRFIEVKEKSKRSNRLKSIVSID